MNIYAKTIRILEILSDSNQHFHTIRTVSSSCMVCFRLHQVSLCFMYLKYESVLNFKVL